MGVKYLYGVRVIMAIGKNSQLPTKQCPNCRSKGKVKCPDCKGRGRPFDCQTCWGL